LTVGALEGDIWVCAECRSINNARAKQCYNCRTPRDLAAVDPAMIEGTGHGKLREVALPVFHSPRPYAFVATILILATAALHVLYTLNSSTLGTQVLGGVPATPVQLRFLDGMQIASFITAVIALVGWSIWLSRAVTAMPALGLGYPAATGLTAFAENFLPGLNLLRVPALVRDVVRRLEPGQNRGEALIFAAWIGLLGGFLVPRVGAVVAGLSADSPETLLRSQLPILGVSTGLVLVGAIFLVALIWWIEARIARRREAQLAAIDAAVVGADAEIAETTEEGVSVEYATAAGPAGEVASEPEPAPPEPQPVAASRSIEPSELIEASELPAVPEPEPDPVPEPAVEPQASNAAGPTNGEAPRLTIRIGNHGMLHAEMGGEIEPVMLEDLTAYGHALAEVGGTANLILDGTDAMVDLIARRAQRILAEAGIDAPIPD
jgi:hypothetical protein